MTAQLHNIRFHVSNVCNLNCAYCHVFKKPLSDTKRLMDFNIVKSALDYYAKQNETHPGQFFKFSFYGGEPLFNWKAIRKALSYGNRMMPGKIEWILNTNGTIITQDKAQIFSGEGVDVHISIDGAHETANTNRRYKTGKPVLNNVLKSLEILKQNQCSVQLDTCLTKENINFLKELIDLASRNRINRIYLALADETDRKEKNNFNVGKISSRLIDALRYARGKKIVLGGPWKCFFPWFSPLANTIVKQNPYLIIGISGRLYFPSFPEIDLGNIEKIETVIKSKTYRAALKKTENIIATCKGCDLETVCSGYLKGMVRYHTGSFKGCEKECSLARTMFYKYSNLMTDNKFEKSMIDVPAIHSKLLETPVVHSRHLIVRKNGMDYRIIHGLNGSAIKASEDMIRFIDFFQQPRPPRDALTTYHIPDISQIVPILKKKSILLDLSEDEELAYLEEKMAGVQKNRMDTAHCICFYPLKEKETACKFSWFIEKQYLKLSSRLHSLRQKIILYLCQDTLELARFWFEPEMPSWVKAFVTGRRILVADIKKITHLDDHRFRQGIVHELVHIFLSDFNVRLPVWLEEGLCEYFSKQDPTIKLLSLIKQKQLLSFEELEFRTVHTLLDIDNARTQENICYHQSHSFVSFICKTFGETKILAQIKSMGLQKKFSQTFYENTGKELIEMEKEWLNRLLN